MLSEDQSAVTPKTLSQTSTDLGNPLGKPFASINSNKLMEANQALADEL